MSVLYFILRILFHYPLYIFFPRPVKINKPRYSNGSTIIVSNHASSFMDPLVLAVFQRPVVYFMTRSDVFKPFLKAFLKSIHMLPIYRQHDGEDTKAKNDEVFNECTELLNKGRNLLIFGEGFTDDVFIRRLKPIKKGALRIGFSTLEKLDWKKNIYIQTQGINYSDPNCFGSRVLISNSDRICLNDYKEDYLENPSKVINDLTKEIEESLQQQLTHVENEKWVFFHEHVSRILQIGMHPTDSNFAIPLQTRWENSRNLANWMNQQELNKNQELIELKGELKNYFTLLKRKKTGDFLIHEISKKNTSKQVLRILMLLVLLPVVPLGLIHFYAPYKFIKNFVEKAFKRRVFWSSVKMAMGFFAMAIINIPLILLAYFFVFKNLVPAYSAWLYYLLLPVIGIATYRWFTVLSEFKKVFSLKKDSEINKLLQTRTQLLEKIKKLVPFERERM
jgi:1-acyl-sn-glycerol-3-phosphate acyltransferase